VIAVTCRNGEHFAVDPSHIERIETDPDTVLYLVDGTHYVTDEPFEDLLRRVRDHRAAFVASSLQLTRTPTRSQHPSTVTGRSHRDPHGDSPSVRLERRQYARDGSGPRDVPSGPASDTD
jgi:uncharacterized protein YlzI (FlbEa/FlbD family)